MRHGVASVFFVLLFAGGSAAQAPARAVVAADGLIYVSGMTGAGADVAAQATAALKEIATLLTSAGSALPNVATVTVMLQNAADLAALDVVFASTWPSAPPARTTIIVGGPLAKPDAAVELTVVAIPSGGERVVIQPAGWKLPPAPYSYGIKTRDTLFLAGLVSRNGADNTPVAGDITVQTKTIMNAASVILKAAGMTLADVVSSRIFLPDMSVFQAMNAEYRTHFPSSPPARATVKAASPAAGSVIEIAMIAVKDPARKTVVPPNADGSPATPSPILSPAIQVGKRLYVAGMLGNTPATKGSVRAQTAETLARLGRALEAAGYSWPHVVEATVFLPDISKAAEMDAAYRSVFTTNPPVRVIMPTALVGADALVEIMLTAVK